MSGVRPAFARDSSLSAGEGGFSRPPHEATRVASIALLLLLLFVSALTFAQVAVPPLTAPVIDQTQTLTPAQIASLEQTIRAFYERKGSQITVLMVPTTQPEAIEQYSIRVVESWKLGRANIDDGVLLLVAKDDRTVRIEVGYGLEGALPDVIANRIVQQVIVPRFRQNDFAGGIAEGIERIIAVVEGEQLPEPERRSQPVGEGMGGQVFPLLLMLVVVGGGILRRMLGGFGGAAVTGGLAGTVAWALTKMIGVGIGAGLIAFFFTLMGGGGGFGGGGWSSHRRGGGSGGWGGCGGGFGGGGGWSGGGGGFGGGGGWSGGGGGFGGGGASGRW